MSEVQPKILLHESDWCCATWEDVFFLVWRGPATVPRAKRVAEFFGAFSNARPGGVGLMTVVNPEAPPPVGEAREIFAQTMRAASTKVRVSSYYIPIEGFKGAAIRGALTGLNLLARNPFSTRAFLTIPEAANWFATRMPGPDPATLGRNVQTIVEKLQALTQPR